MDQAFDVTIRAGNIGGPSAGLMFALEIYNQFTESDWTKGYTIAGTGEMSPDGTVGTIGGVIHKVTAAHRKGAELFFVPFGNAEAAKRKAAELGTPMEIVPVGTLREALDYLETLPEKETRTGDR
jgi:PDZ domain-containing protein